jgi:transcription antitermination factor NusA-like protein
MQTMSSLLSSEWYRRDLGLVADDSGQFRLVTATIVDVDGEQAHCRLRDGSEAGLWRAEWYSNRPFVVGQNFVALQAAPGGELSVTHPELLHLLVASYVPELSLGEVRVLAVAREAGVRSKVAVAATVDTVDPVGACVGKRAGRITAVMRALGGNERVELVAWHPDPAVYVANALGPVGVQSIRKTGDAWLACLPLHAYDAAVGGGAMNVKLASALVGEKIIVTTPDAQSPGGPAHREAVPAAPVPPGDVGPGENP